jgi:hypothetical protein
VFTARYELKFDYNSCWLSSLKAEIRNVFRHYSLILRGDFCFNRIAWEVNIAIQNACNIKNKFLFSLELFNSFIYVRVILGYGAK